MPATNSRLATIAYSTAMIAQRMRVSAANSLSLLPLFLLAMGGRYIVDFPSAKSV
jgi:hypothetical protein